MLGIIINTLKNPKLLKPTYKLNNVGELTNNHLNGVRCIVFDKDDTLTALGEYQIVPKLRQKVDHLSKDYTCCIVSNDPKPSNIEKVGTIPILKTIKIKPHNFSQIFAYFQKVTKDSSLSPKQTAVVGDRLFTDIYLANLNGCVSIYVKPLFETTVRTHGLTVFLLRKIEQKIITFSE